jgi:hypothetical protein
MNAQDDSRKLSSWLLPSVSHWLWLLLLVMLLSQPWRTAIVASDGDACMHWRVGEWMLQHQQIIRTDVFSHTMAGQPIISKEWLSEIIFALAGRVAGLYGLAVLSALVIATTFALLFRQLLRAGSDLLVATAVSVLGVWASSTHWLARPHVFSFLLIFLWNDALRRRRFALLPVLTVLWVNLHGGFLAGFLVLGAYWAGAVLERDWQRLRALTGTGATCAMVSLLNPSGYELHLHNWAFLQSNYLTNWLAEYSSANFHSTGSWGFLAWLAVIFLTLVARRPRVRARDGLLLISWTYFALYASRNIPLMVIVTAPIVAPAWSPVLWPGLSARLRAINDSSRGWPVMLALAAAFVVFVPHPTEMPADRWPVRAVGFIRQHPEQFAGNMFNQYMWGGYLMEILPERKTFVDGRTDFFGEDLIREFSDTTALRTNWVTALEKYHVQWMLMPTDHRLNLALAEWGTWSCVHSDEVAMIWRRNL